MKEGHARDVLIAAAVVGGILLVLYVYTGNWPPPVVVESNSMMHVEPDEYQLRHGTSRGDGVPFGRIGTIDPGDLVLVKRAGSLGDIDTFAASQDDHYGMGGDVIVYYRFGDRGVTPIIHRAMTHVTVGGTPNAPTYTVLWNAAWTEAGACVREPVYQCTFGDEGITIEEQCLRSRRFAHSGFLTKGDNVVGNKCLDQVLGIMSEPVKFEWIQGVARGELPWFGLIKLMLTDPANKNGEVQAHPYYWTIGKMTAPKDLWIMLVVGLAFVGFAPVGLDAVVHRMKRGRQEGGPPADAEQDLDPPPGTAMARPAGYPSTPSTPPVDKPDGSTERVEIDMD